ncbi:MAG: hypothetical protein ABI821_05265 [Pseudomonadota bacterium]
MNAKHVRAVLTEVLQTIQTTSGLDCPAIVGTTKPIEELPKFDSKIWPVAIGMLGVKLGITIANDVNIFRREKTTIALTVDEAVAVVLALAETQPPAPIQMATAK